MKGSCSNNGRVICGLLKTSVKKQQPWLLCWSYSMRLSHRLLILYSFPDPEWVPRTQRWSRCFLSDFNLFQGLCPFSSSSLFLEFIHLFIPYTFIEHILYFRHYAAQKFKMSRYSKMDESQPLLSKSFQLSCSRMWVWLCVCVGAGETDTWPLNVIVWQDWHRDICGYGGSTKGEGSVTCGGARQRCHREKVTPELSPKHDLGRVSKSRNGAKGRADAQAMGWGESGAYCQECESAMRLERQAEVRTRGARLQAWTWLCRQWTTIRISKQKNKIRCIFHPSHCGHRM